MYSSYNRRRQIYAFYFSLLTILHRFFYYPGFIMHSCNTFPTDLIFFYRKTGDRHELNHDKKTGCMKPVLRKKAKLQELNSGSIFSEIGTKVYSFPTTKVTVPSPLQVIIPVVKSTEPIICTFPVHPLNFPVPSFITISPSNVPSGN